MFILVYYFAACQFGVLLFHEVVWLMILVEVCSFGQHTQVCSFMQYIHIMRENNCWYRVFEVCCFFTHLSKHNILSLKPWRMCIFSIVMYLYTPSEGGGLVLLIIFVLGLTITSKPMIFNISRWCIVLHTINLPHLDDRMYYLSQGQFLWILIRF